MTKAVVKKVQDKPVQYYKVINPYGHHGLIYRMGLNVDPKAIPLNKVGSCGVGAIYFTTEEYLYRFKGYGSLIAWVTPESHVVRDGEGDKWKAHKITITKMLPIKDALQAIYKGKSIKFLLKVFREWGEDYTQLMVAKLPIVEKYEYLNQNKSTAECHKFLRENIGNKTLLKYLVSDYSEGEYMVSNEVEFMVLSGYPLHRIENDELSRAYTDSLLVRKYIKAHVAESDWKLIHNLLKTY